MGCISALSFSEIYKMNDVNAAFNSFYEIFILFYNLCFPKIKVKTTKKDLKPRWITQGLKKSSKTKRNLFMKFRHNAQDKTVNKHRYLTYSSLYKKCVHKAQQITNTNYIKTYKNPCKATWNVINSQLNQAAFCNEINAIKYNNKISEVPEEISDIFNKYFTNLSSESSNSHNNNYNRIPINSYTMYLPPTDSKEIFNIIMSLNNSNSVGYDEIDTKILKLCAIHICDILAYIINLTFLCGDFPEKLKYSVVKPLFKKGDKLDLNNYRPITLIPIIAKIFEKAMYRRLDNFLNKHNIIKREQFGFRPRSSTSLACFHLVKEITESIDKKQHVACVFLDMSKAFDFVNHNTLLNKLERLGVRGKAQEWFRSYLTGRKQCTEIVSIAKNCKQLFRTSHRSDFRLNNSGVPQGSILGPLLFLTYINDLPDALNQKCILFADDTTLIVKSNDHSTLQHKIQDSLNITISWLKENNLSLNPLKSKCIQFHSQRAQPINIQIKCENVPIEVVDSTTFLGINVDRSCTWKVQINSVCKKLERFVYALKRLRQTVSKDAAICAYHGHVSSILSYGLIIWGNSVEINRVFLIQKKCIRAITGAYFLDSCRPLFRELGVLPLASMYIKEICLFSYKHPNLHKKQSETMERQTRFCDRLHMPRHRLDIYSRNVFIMIIKIFNKLPAYFKEMSFREFKHKLHKWLVDKCFYSLKEYFEFNER